MLISLGFISVDAHIVSYLSVSFSTPYGSQHPIYKVAPSPHGSTCVLLIQNCMGRDYNVILIDLYNMLIM